MIDIKDISGLVLASGTSRRMGRDKTALIYNGTSLLEISLGCFRALGLTNIYINDRHNLADIIPNLGPLGGIYTALETYPKTNYWFITPVDMPLLTTEVYETLLAGLKEASVARFDGEIFPLLLKVTDEMRIGLARLAKDKTNTYSMRAFLDAYSTNIIPTPDRHIFFYLNRKVSYWMIAKYLFSCI